MIFIVAVPRCLLAEEIQAESPEDAVRGLSDSGGFAQAINNLDIDFEELLAGKNPLIATVVDPQGKVARFQLEIGWRVAPVEPDVPF